MKKGSNPPPPFERPGCKPPPPPPPPRKRSCVQVIVSTPMPPKPPPGPPGRTYKDIPFVGMIETKESKISRIKYHAFMEGYNYARGIEI